MICINCLQPDTSVTNSRPHKKQATTWRRRRCKYCGIDFTTQEKPVLNATTMVIHDKTGKIKPFYYGEIIHSVARSFAHDEEFGVISAPALCETIVATLLPLKNNPLKTSTIAFTCYHTLLRFDKAAAAQYALIYGITPTPKRRRKNA